MRKTASRYHQQESKIIDGNLEIPFKNNEITLGLTKTKWDLLLSRWLSMMNFSRAISRVKWLSGEKTNVSKTISVLALRVLVWQD
jgi:hypothetical protein